MATILYDVSRPLSDATPVWPGDQPLAFRWTMRQDRGDSVNVGQFASTVHIGTHADAPLHFDSDGASIDRLPLDAFVGPAQLIDVRSKWPITVDDLQRLIDPTTRRLLLRTDGWPDPDVFPPRIPVVAGDVPAFLAAHGVCLLGVDVPSVDLLDSHDLPNHRALGKYGIAILESLDLTAVPEGQYELIALPLRMVGADASPIRAILRSLD